MRHKFHLQLFCCLLLIISLLSGCNMGTVTLSDEQEEKVDIICQNVDTWGDSYYDSGRYWPKNQIYISELESGTTVVTVGCMAEGSQATLGAKIELGVCSYAVTDHLIAINVYQSEALQWSVHGISIDLETMSDQELREAIEQSYIQFLNQK